MITINCPMKQDFVIDLLVKSNEEIKYELVEHKGMKLVFKVSTDDLDEAIATAKKIIKSTEIGSVLYMQYTK